MRQRKPKEFSDFSGNLLFTPLSGTGWQTGKGLGAHVVEKVNLPGKKKLPGRVKSRWCLGRWTAFRQSYERRPWPFPSEGTHPLCPLQGDPSMAAHRVAGPESEDLEQRIHQINNESLESTRRMLQLVDESKDAGIRTLVMLDDQGEQLDRIEDGLDQIIQDMKEAEKNLSDMAKCCGLFVCPCAKLKNMKAMEANKAASGNAQDVVSQQPMMMTAGTQMMMSGPFIQRIMKDDVEEELEQNLTQVDSMLSNLRSMAVDMSNEIDVQSKQVENIKEKAVANVISINEANNQTTKMLKKA
ncbi:synaptosomal-associated protein 25-like isoform X1 [Ahaetulla prasina]|uniref:synaptosomal-associated protein 25-like isoform X1 n=2 Tax=Ahaetulla prasina TaxID=499056 RepID=UPI0026480F90|nr:synaptosomal-associated protein 25-like isoform X1 [Ahaetulla prasina]